MTPVLIGLDWGTSALRAYLIGPGGAVLERRESGHGIRALPDGGFPAAFAAATTGWPEVPVLMSGMVGSRAGWREAPYAAVPAGVAELARDLEARRGGGRAHRLHRAGRDGAAGRAAPT